MAMNNLTMESTVTVPCCQDIVNDIVHGIISLPPHIKAIIDTSQFQRLRYVSQLGMTKFVYPCAAHSRFEHSIGTFHLVSQVLRNLRPDFFLVAKEEPIDIDHLIQCIEIAALCHDLGHGPFSHVWDCVIIPNIETDVNKMKSHEEMSVEILQDLIVNSKDNRLTGLKNRDSLVLIGTIIMGNFDVKKKEIEKQLLELKKQVDIGKQECEEKQEKLKEKKKWFQKYERMPFIFEIVANKRSGLDLDKCEYLCRDPIYLGWSNRDRIREIERMIHFYRLSKYKGDGKWHLAVRNIEIFNLHNLFYSRHLIHRYGCQHKTVRAVEGMLKNAVIRIFTDNEANKRKLFKSVMGQSWTESVSFCSKEFMSKACDYHVWEMIRKYDPGNMVERINERRLYKLLCKYKIITWDIFMKDLDRHVTEINKILKDVDRTNEIGDSFPEEEENTFYVDVSKFRLRSEPKGDPLKLIPFYEKQSPNECFMFGDDDRIDSLPELVKLIQDESILMIFITKPIDKFTKEKHLESFRRILMSKEPIDETSQWQTQLKQYVDVAMEKYKFRELKY